MDRKGKAIQICGTGSGVGKSVIATGLCRIFLQDSYKVCPFKAQNMALNSFVTKEKGEIGRAQATQATACRIEPSVYMNPVLIKPTADTKAQIIVLGKSIGNKSASNYIKYKTKLVRTVKQSFDRLISEYEIVVIEGAGSPAEINLKSHDIVNMKMADYADAPVILVGDIDRGGVFAWLIGTLELLTKEERKRVKGIIINKFRGDKKLLAPAIAFLEKRTAIKVLGVVPYFKDIMIGEEDSVSLEYKSNVSVGKNSKIVTAVIRLPHISNFTDFDALEKERDVVLKYVKRPYELDGADIIIIPGTKNTISDLLYLKKSGIAERIISAAKSGSTSFIIGICGGYQMLGVNIYDAHGIETNHRKTEGLGILPVTTRLKKKKVLTRVEAIDLISGTEISGYEIHHGDTKCPAGYKAVFKVIKRDNKDTGYLEGLRSEDGRIFGSYIHGLFDRDLFRRNILNRIRQDKGWREASYGESFNIDREIDKLALLFRKNIDMEYLYKIINSAKKP